MEGGTSGESPVDHTEMCRGNRICYLGKRRVNSPEVERIWLFVFDVDQITEPLEYYYLSLQLCSESLKLKYRPGDAQGGASFNDFIYTLALWFSTDGQPPQGWLHKSEGPLDDQWDRTVREKNWTTWLHRHPTYHQGPQVGLAFFIWGHKPNRLETPGFIFNFILCASLFQCHSYMN